MKVANNIQKHNNCVWNDLKKLKKKKTISKTILKIVFSKQIFLNIL